MDNDNDNEVIVETGRKTTKTSLITAYSSIYMTDIEYLYSWGTNFARNFLLFFWTNRFEPEKFPNTMFRDTIPSYIMPTRAKT